MPLEPGVHALANEPADAPCPRAERLRAALETMVAAGADPEGLLDTLMVEDGPTLFLRGDIYGTRASRSEEQTSELQSQMRNSYAVFCLQKKYRAIELTIKSPRARTPITNTNAPTYANQKT